jgi:hypothetical protein
LFWKLNAIVFSPGAASVGANLFNHDRPNAAEICGAASVSAFSSDVVVAAADQTAANSDHRSRTNPASVV